MATMDNSTKRYLNLDKCEPRDKVKITSEIQPQLAQQETWHAEPPFEKDSVARWCWVEGYEPPANVYWSNCDGWMVRWQPNLPWKKLDGRRVSPIAKPLS